jgi:D-tyrosyl-tRNA(Tyr) deacylase
VDRAGDVLELRFEPRDERRLRVLARALWQAVTLADTISGNDASGAGGAYVVRRRADGAEVVRVDVTHDEIGATRAHLEQQLAELSPERFTATWSRNEEQP